MYQWVNPTTGRTQLSGKAPSWYRSDTGGPRILVFEKNVLIDDTSVAVADDQRQLLRSKALPTEFAKKQEAINQQQAIAKLEEQIEAIVESPEMEAYLKNPPSEENSQATGLPKPTQATKVDQKSSIKSTEEIVAESADERVERLKALINAWDQNKTASAKLLLESEASAKTTTTEVKE